MKLSQFVSLLKAGHPFETVRNFIHMDIKDVSDEKRVAQLFRAARKLPGYSSAKNQDDARTAITDELKNWRFAKLPSVEELESVTDFSERTGERIKIAADEYARYFDAFLTEDDEDRIGLPVEIFSKNRKKSFKAVIHGKAVRVERQNAVSEYLPVSELDLDFVALMQYLMVVDGAETDSGTSVPEAIARGSAFMSAASITGGFVNNKFLELFKDFF